MKPPDLRTLVTRQTDQITILTSQLEASLIHNAKLNTRLSSALDTLDILQAELDAERRKNDKHLWTNLIQELQKEKEEMKEAVELLIRRVERSKGNFDRWPSAKMYLPTPAGRSPALIDFTPVPVTPPRMEALLNALAYERGRYKHAAEALHNAHEIILTLEAQVARREAELESRDQQHIMGVKPIPQKRSLVEALRPNIPEVPLSEVVHSLSIAEERNHALEREVHELNNSVLEGEHSLRFTSIAVQTSPLQGIEAGYSMHRSSPTTPTQPIFSSGGGVINTIEDLQACVDLFSDAINGFKKERRSIQNTIESRMSDPPSTSPPSVSVDVGAPQIPHSPPQRRPLPQPSSRKRSPNKSQPDFQHILRVEDECIRLTRMNECLERELSELRAIINASPASDTSSILFSRSPALPSPALPAVSPSGFSVRSSGERDMEISSTPLHLPSTLPDEEDNDRNHLSDFDFFLGQTQPPVANNSSMNAEPSGSDPIHPNSQEGGNNCSTNRPSSAPPDIDDTRPSVLLSPFQPSVSLPPRSKSVEPRSRYQERMLQIQRELDIVNEDLASKNKDLNELRELASRLKDQVI